MYCKICGNEELITNLLGEKICENCIEEITNTNVYDETYDYYKNLIRILLGYYISGKHQLNPVN